MNPPARIARVAGVLLWCAAGVMGARSALAAGPTTGPATRPAAPWAWKDPTDWSFVSADRDPIGFLADRMQDVEIGLKHVETGVPVQAKEKDVVSELDTLIALLNKQCKGSGGGNPNPTKPMGSSTLAKGPGGSGPMHDAKEGTRVWGQLPPKMRDQILQSQTEGFPPGYESVLASYYARLAQGQVPADAGESPAGPATKPAAP